MSSWIDCLNARRIVHMGYRGKLGPSDRHSDPEVWTAHALLLVFGQDGSPLLPDGGNHQHVGAFLSWAHREDFVGVIKKNTGRKGPEGFPELDFQIHLLLHLGRA